MLKAKQKLDQEWVELMLQARKEGISPNEIRDFFKDPLIYKKAYTTKVVTKYTSPVPFTEQQSS